MWFTHLFHLVAALGGYTENRNMEQHDRQVARLLGRRQFAHMDVPPIEVIEARHGAHFDQLVSMLVEADPGRLHTRRSRAGKDPEHQRLMRQRYRLLAWTLIHRLSPPDAIDQVHKKANCELWLWFGDRYELPEHDPIGLVARLTQWRKRWDFA